MMHKLPTHLLIFVALILTTFSKPTTTTFETKANGQSLTKNEETIHKCNDIIATTSIAVHTNINLKQHFKITGSIEDWEEEYDEMFGWNSWTNDIELFDQSLEMWGRQNEKLRLVESMLPSVN